MRELRGAFKDVSVGSCFTGFIDTTGMWDVEINSDQFVDMSI